MFRERSRAFDGREYRSVQQKKTEKERTTKVIALLELEVRRD